MKKRGEGWTDLSKHNQTTNKNSSKINYNIVL